MFTKSSAPISPEELGRQLDELLDRAGHNTRQADREATAASEAAFDKLEAEQRRTAPVDVILPAAETAAVIKAPLAGVMVQQVAPAEPSVRPPQLPIAG